MTKTFDISRQEAICNGYYFVSHIKDRAPPIKFGYYQSPFGERNKDWFTNEIEIEDFRMSEIFKHPVRSKIEKHWECECYWLCDIKFDNYQEQYEHYCNLSGNSPGNADESCIEYLNKKGKHKNIHVLYHSFRWYDSHLFSKDLIDIKKLEK